MKRLLLLSLAALPFAASGQGFQVNLHGQKQIGMGNTGTGLALDGAAILFNPGAVAMLEENYVQAGISPLLFQSAFQPSGSDAQYFAKNKVATPATAYAVWGPHNGRWKAGFGMYTPFGGLVDWGNTWQGRYVLESLDLKAIYLQPTFSIKITDELSIGAGVVYNIGIVNLQKAIPLTDANGADGHAELKGTGDGWGWNGGIYYRPCRKFSVGLSYRSKVETTIDGGDAVFNVPASLSASFPSGNKFSSSIPLPSTTSIGFGFYPNDRLTLGLDVNYVHWSVYESLDFDYEQNTPALQDTHSPRNYKDAFSFRLGGAYKTRDDVAIRAGGGYVLTAVRDGYVTPEAPDANRFYLTAGLGYTINGHWDVDASLLYENIAPRTQTNTESNLSGTFKTNVFAPGLSVSYHW